MKNFVSTQYQVSYELFHEIDSFDQRKHVCITCDKHLNIKNTPPQAVSNKLILDPIPDILANLNRLEKTLISKRIPFKKVTIMPKGQQPKIRGAMCNIPIQAETVSNVLPSSTDNDRVILVKLKRKIEFKGHVYFESVRPCFVESALNYLKENNHFNSNVLINLDNINRELLCLSDIESIVEKGEFEIVVENEDGEHLENNNPLDVCYSNYF